MHANLIRLVVALMLCLGIGSSAVLAGAQTDDITLGLYGPDGMSTPDGITFQTLATGDSAAPGSHADGMYLHRIALACGEATGEIVGSEQITFVEYGQVDVRDWESGDVIATLSAGDAFGPAGDEMSFFLASQPGWSARVFHFSTSAAGKIGDLLPASFETTNCVPGESGAQSAEPADVTVLLSNGEISDSMPDVASTLYVGLLTVDPGEGIGRFGEGDGSLPVSVQSPGAIVPVVGGFGDGIGPTSDAASVGPDIAPGTAAAMTPGANVLLANTAPMPTVALVFGVIVASPSSTVFIQHHTDR